MYEEKKYSVAEKTTEEKILEKLTEIYSGLVLIGIAISIFGMIAGIGVGALLVSLGGSG